ncbi:MAG TPA: hypothetical protein VN820_07325 [Acidimicrobiales bacterium]|nr:hypothetical protein [Acidimicrobiales bacterium]
MNVLLSTAPTTIPLGAGVTIPTYPGGSGAFQGGGSSIAVPGAGLGLGSLLGLLAGVLAVVAVLALVGVLVIVVVANRADPDPSGRRPQSVYFFAVSFVTIVSAIIASTVVVSALVRLIGSHASPIADSIARSVVLGGLITLVSLFLLVTHLRRGLALALADPQSTTPSRRVGQSYVAAVAFVSVVLLLVVTVFSLYLIFALAGPGVFGSFGGHAPALRYLIDAVYLGAVLGVILWTHRNLVPPGLRLLGAGAGRSAPAPPPVPAAPPFPPPA